jgi:arylsulfatase A-like enzyme
MRPNIVVILADDLGWGDLGCYGQKRIRTPHLDQMAADGVRFTAAYAGSTVCAPSRSCLITGQHTGHTRVRGNDYVPLRPTDPSLGNLLKSAGYATGIVGKWGLGEPGTTGVPEQQGFDHFFGYLNQVHAHDSYPTELWRGNRKVRLTANDNDAQGAYSNDLFRDDVLEFVENHRKRPFFLLWSHTIPHAFPAKKTIEVPQIEPAIRNQSWPDIEKRFASAVIRMDRQVGEFRAKLRALGLERNTLVLFVSDNGPQNVPPHDPDFFDSNGPWKGVKRDLAEGGIRVPAIAVGPGLAKPGSVVDSPWAFWDLPPTFAEIAGARVPKGMDGISVADVWRGDRNRPHPPFYWEFHERGFEQAVRDGKWKGIRSAPDAPLALHDLQADPGETTDVASRHPDVATRLTRFLGTARTDSTDFPIRPKP